MSIVQAVIDDSASESGDKRLFLAGYVNRAEKWGLFADAWEDELISGKAIGYLHMVEAAALRGQFRGWTKAQRDEKLRGLMRVARHFSPFSFHFSVSRATYWNTVTPVAPRGLSPHFVCSFGMIAQLARHVATIDSKARVEFIFDRANNLEDEIDLLFDDMIKRLPRKARKMICSQPRFLDDKSFTPLQAADLLAWHLRRSHEDFGDWRAERNELVNRAGHLHSEIDSSLPGWAEAFSRMRPSILKMQSKSDWRNLKREIRNAKANGYIPPYGTHWKNFKASVQEKLKKLTGRLTRQ